MFCPKCGTHDEAQQKFCRQCGQTLANLQLALHSQPDESVKYLEDAKKWLNGGSITLLVFTVVALTLMLTGFLIANPTLINIAIINALCGLCISLPLIFFGKHQLTHALHKLSPKLPTTNQFQPTKNDASTASLANASPYPAGYESSITEQTTRNLEQLPQPKPLKN